MKYILDTANVEYIKFAMEYFPIAGITTNPTIIAKENKNFLNLIKQIKNLIGDKRSFHIQVVGNEAEKMIEEGKVLINTFGENICVKIPVTKEGFKAIKKLKSEGINVTATAIYTSQQALMAARAGADYVAPYVNRIDNLCSNGCSVVGNIVKLFKEFKIETKVIAASFKNIEQIQNVANLGAHYATVNPEVFDKIYYHNYTDLSVKQFTEDWEKIYIDKTILDLV